MKPALNLGAWRYLNGADGGPDLILPAAHLVTHGVVVGMTGSGKTGLVTVMIEEAAEAGVPTIVIDVKGDLPNLPLAFPDFDPARLEPWVEVDRDANAPGEAAARARAVAEERRAALAACRIGEAELGAYAYSRRAAPRVSPCTCFLRSNAALRAGIPIPKRRAMRFQRRFR
jgi:DNA helicase HerA-like ATPase